MAWPVTSSPVFRSARGRSAGSLRAMAENVARVAGLLVMLGHVAAGQGALTVSRGVEALIRRDVPAATRFFRQAAVDSNPSIRSAGERWLGHLSWKVYADSRSAAV